MTTDPADLLALFDRLTTDLVDALAGLDDWGLSGRRETQYTHDVVADDLIIAGLLDAGLAVLTEESGVVAANEDAPVTVVVDPVDGSTNASQGLPWYATSLCAVDTDGPLAASVTNLATGERWEAIRGEGVLRGRVAPSSVTSGDDAIVAFSGLPPRKEGFRQFRAYGAAALDLCSVAAGRFDGYVDIDGAHGVWDYLGAALVCSEAGVPMVDAMGRDLLTFDPSERRAPVAAATPELCDELVTVWRSWASG